MKIAERFASKRMFLAVVALLVAWFSARPTPAAAQGSQGQDAVYKNPTAIVGSSAFIDASMFAGTGTTFCSTIYSILLGATSAVFIDARGLNSGNTNMTCASGWTPWNNGATFLNKPSTILLPAGTIVIPTTWVLPQNTRLVGEGENNPLSSAPGTTIQANSGTLLSTIIQFGSSSSSGISVEQLTLDGQAQAVHGIVNQFSRTNTYVDHVTLYQILGTGLLISGSGATNSGPYTNITFDTGIYAGLLSTVCAQIIGTSGTRGIHGLKCKSETHDAAAAVLLDSSNNSISDVTIVGFYDGILVGSNAAAHSNVLINIIGDTTANGSTPVNAVHISPNPSVSDLSIMGVKFRERGSPPHRI